MIIIVDNYGSFAFNLYQAVVKFHSAVEVVDSKKINLNALKEANPLSLILSSGPGLPEENPINREIVRLLAPNIPILGISLGHLSIGECFGARIVPVHHFDHGKAIDIRHRSDELFANLPNPFKAGCYHAFILSKEHFPTSLKILAESSDGAIMSIRHQNYPCYGVQFYPETVLTPHGDIILHNFIEISSRFSRHIHG